MRPDDDVDVVAVVHDQFDFGILVLHLEPASKLEALRDSLVLWHAGVQYATARILLGPGSVYVSVP